MRIVTLLLLELETANCWTTANNLNVPGSTCPGVAHASSELSDAGRSVSGMDNQ